MGSVCDIARHDRFTNVSRTSLSSSFGVHKVQKSYKSL